MKDLIERQAAINAMAQALWLYPNEYYRNLNVYAFAKGLAEIGLRSVPSAQPAPCEFCKHNNIADDKVCLMCSAERRTDEGD